MAELTGDSGRKGQAFIIGAVIFSLLLLLVFTTTGPKIVDQPAETQPYFFKTLSESSSIFNSAMEENYSIRYVRSEMQSYDSFVERRSLEKGIDYSSYDIVVFPKKGEAVFTNKMDENLDVRLKTDDWENDSSLGTGQSLNNSFPSGTISIDLRLAERDENHTFTASTPKLLKKSVMDSEGETWEDVLLG